MILQLCIVRLHTWFGFADHEPITREFFNANIAGRHNPDIAADLFPAWSVEQHVAFSDEKEAYFRQLALGSALPTPGHACIPACNCLGHLI